MGNESEDPQDVILVAERLRLPIRGEVLKALLEEHAIAVEKTHELGRLLNRLASLYPALRSLRRGLVFLTNFAVEPRYPGENTTRRQATAALRWAGRVRKACRDSLGMQTS